MIQSPTLVASHLHRCEEFLDASCQIRIARRRVLHLVQFRRKPAEVMDRPRRGAYGYGCVLNVPVGGTERIAFGFGSVLPSAVHRSVYGFTRNAFIGFPCPMNRAGIRCDIVSNRPNLCWFCWPVPSQFDTPRMTLKEHRNRNRFALSAALGVWVGS